MSLLVDYGDTSSSAESSDEVDKDHESDGGNSEHSSTTTDKKSDGRIESNKRKLSSVTSGCVQENSPPRKKILDSEKKDGDATIEFSIASREMAEAQPKKQPLNLPTAIHSMFNKKQTWVDKPSEHGFRVRSFPHVEGNWATHIFIPVSQNENFTKFVKNVLNVFMPLEFHAMSEYHISLSRTVVIRHHWIESLVDSLRENLSCLSSCLADISSVKLYTNEEKSRTFVCLETPSEDTFLMDYTKAVDKSFAEFKLPSFYTNPSFHISIGWCLGDVSGKISNDTLMTAKSCLATFCAANPDLSIVFARQICCQSGNKSFLIPLLDLDQ